MIQLLKKEKKFEWSVECEESFQILRDLLTKAPVLILPDIHKSFDIYCDGPDLVVEAEEQVRLIRDRLRTTWSRRKSYTDHRRRELSFEVDEYVYLKVSPMKRTHRFQVKGKLASRFIGPFQIIAKRGAVAYQLELPDSLSAVHDTFHVSQLKKCLRVPTEATAYESLDLQPDLSYQEQPVRILDKIERRTRNRTVKFLKIQWSNHRGEEATWEREDLVRLEHPHLFHD